MDILLLALTIMSLLVAAAMTAVAWKLKRDARRRSDARVAVLEALAFGDARDEEAVEPPAAFRATEADVDAAPAPARPSWDGVLGSHAGRRPPPLDRDEAEVTAAPAAMFVPVVRTSPGARRAAVLAAVAIVMIAGVSAAYLVRGDFSWPAFPAMAGASAAASDAVTPLELLSLRHDVAGPGQFTVTGLVQNPQQGRAVAGLVAVVYLFDGQGRFLASGRAPLESAALRPGDEAPFVVTIPATTEEVTRYRVGFRLEDGAVVAHVDRRGQAPANTTGDAVDVDPPAGRARRVEG
jgi:hypothetical protein